MKKIVSFLAAAALAAGMLTGLRPDRRIRLEVRAGQGRPEDRYHPV